MQKPRIRIVSLVERFDCVLFPFDLMFLFDRLPEAGWIVGERIDEAATESIRVKAPVKGNLRLRVDQSTMLLGIHGRELESLVEEFERLRELAIEVSPPAPEVKTHYVEFRCVGEVRSDRPPSTSFQEWWNGSENISGLVNSLADLMPPGELLSPYGVRLSTPGVDANRPDWFEIAIVPVNNTGHTDYSFDFLYRNKEVDRVFGMVGHCESIIETLLSSIEGR